MLLVLWYSGLLVGRLFVVVLFILGCCFAWLVFVVFGVADCHWGLIALFRSFRLALGWLLLAFISAVVWWIGVGDAV